MTHLTCKDHSSESISLPKGINSQLIPKCRADLNVTILIGLLRWRLSMKRSEIRTYLQKKGIFVSKGAISYRSLDFLLLFKQLHNSKKDEIKDFLDTQGGIILHIDGTHRSGGKVVFVLQEGLNDIVLDAGLISSESEENVTPLLALFKENYGKPHVTVRDMAQGLASGVSSVFPNAPQQICQIHFLRCLEKDLVTKYHKNMKSSIVKHKITSKLRSLRVIECENDKKKIVLKYWVHIAVDYLLHPIEKRVKWISRPIAYFVHYQRIEEVSCLVKRLIQSNASNNFAYKPLMNLNKYLRSVLDDSNTLNSSNLLEMMLEWLDKLRNQLRISREGHLKDSSPDNVELEDVLKNIKELLAKIEIEGQQMGKKYSKIASKINEAFENHWDELFVPEPVVNGKKIRFRRHNNGLESSHRRTRKAIRERTGRSETNSEMEQFGDLLAILSNLWNKTYQKEILYNVEDLSYSLSQFVDDLPRLRKGYHQVRQGPQLPIADEKRQGILNDFVSVLESSKSFDDVIDTLQSILSVDINMEVSCEA